MWGLWMLPDRGETMENIEDVDEFLEKPTATMPPLPPLSWFKKTKISRCVVAHLALHPVAKPVAAITAGMDVNLQPSAFDCRDCNQRFETEAMLIALGRFNHDLRRHGWTDMLQQVNPWSQKTQKSTSRARGCAAENVLVCQGSRHIHSAIAN